MCCVPVCYVKYASFLWSGVIIILGSSTVFICFKAVSKFWCFRVLLYSTGSWVLRWQVLNARWRLFQVIAFSKTSNYQIRANTVLHRCLSRRYIIPYILNTLVLHGTFYVQWKVMVWGSLRGNFPPSPPLPPLLPQAETASVYRIKYGFYRTFCLKAFVNK